MNETTIQIVVKYLVDQLRKVLLTGNGYTTYTVSWLSLACGILSLILGFGPSEGAMSMVVAAIIGLFSRRAVSSVATELSEAKDERDAKIEALSKRIEELELLSSLRGERNTLPMLRMAPDSDPDSDVR